MAITLIEAPQAYMPVYNPIYLTVSSDKTAEDAFSFIFDIYVNGNFINRDRLVPKPASIEATYSPATILESFLSFDKSQSYTAATPNQNCILDYQINVGEEWIEYWNYYNNAFVSAGPFYGFTILYSTGNTHTYIAGDSVYVEQSVGYAYPGYNGIFTVMSANTTSIIIDAPYVSTPVNGGRVVYSDKRKKVTFGSVELLQDPEMNNQAYWTTYGPDGSGNSIALNGSGQMNWQQYSASTFVTKYSQAIGSTFIPGVNYSVTYQVYDKFPATGTSQTSYVSLGGTLGTVNNGIGTFTQNITCGTGTTFQLYGASTGTGLRGITFERASVILTGISGHSWNGVIQYEDVPVWDYKQFEMVSGNTGQYLTNQPDSARLTRYDDRGSIGWMNVQPPLAGAKYWLFVVGNPNDVVPRTPIPFEITGMTATTTANRIIEFGIYPWNLNQASQATYGVDVIDAGVSEYSVLLLLEADPIGDPYNFKQVADTINFTLDTSCSKFSPVRFMILGALGQMEFFNATLLSRETINISRTTFTKPLLNNYQVGDRGKTVVGLESNQTYVANTNFIDEDTARWLVEMANTTEAYVLDNSTGALTPVVLDFTSYEPKKHVNNKLISYTFTYSKAVGINTARG